MNLYNQILLSIHMYMYMNINVQEFWNYTQNKCCWYLLQQHYCYWQQIQYSLVAGVFSHQTMVSARILFFYLVCNFKRGVGLLGGGGGGEWCKKLFSLTNKFLESSLCGIIFHSYVYKPYFFSRNQYMFFRHL